MAVEGGSGNPTSWPLFEGDEAGVLKRQLPPRLGAGLLTTVKTGIRPKRPSRRSRHEPQGPRVRTQTRGP